MPCYDPFTDPKFRKEFYSTKQEDELTEKMRQDGLQKEILDRLNDVTELLCSLTNTMKLEDITNEKLKSWVIEHRTFDKSK